MRSMTVLSAAVVLLTCSMGWPQVVQHSSPTPPNDGAAATPLQVYIDSMFPDPIRESDLTRYYSFLQLSDDQQQAVRRCFDDVKGELDTIHSDAMGTLRNLGHTAAMQSSQSTEFALAYSQLMQQRSSFFEHMRRVEDQFLAAIEPLMTDRQLERMAVVRADRDRMSFSAVTCPWDIADSRIDLVTLISQLQPDYCESGELLGVLAAYVTELAPPCKRKAEKALTTTSALMFLASQGDPDTLLRERRAAWAQIMPLVRNLSTINRRYLEECSKHLKPLVATKLRERYNALAFPSLYPDDESATIVFDYFERLDVLDQSQQEAVCGMRSLYNSSYHATCGRLEELETDWREKVVSTGMSFASDEDEYRVKLMKELAERKRVNDQARTQLTSILTPEQLQTLGEVNRRKKQSDAPSSGAGTLAPTRR